MLGGFDVEMCPCAVCVEDIVHVTNCGITALGRQSVITVIKLRCMHELYEIALSSRLITYMCT